MLHCYIMWSRRCKLITHVKSQLKKIFIVDSLLKWNGNEISSSSSTFECKLREKTRLLGKLLALLFKQIDFYITKQVFLCVVLIWNIHGHSNVGALTSALKQRQLTFVQLTPCFLTNMLQNTASGACWCIEWKTFLLPDENCTVNCPRS